MLRIRSPIGVRAALGLHRRVFRRIRRGTTSRSRTARLLFASLLVLAVPFAKAGADGEIFSHGFESIALDISEAEASRFLQQAAFGPTDADIARVREIGYSAWIDEQLLAPPSYGRPYLEWAATVDAPVYGGVAHDFHRMEAWLQNAVGGPDAANPLIVHNDQLRQRVAFALSELFVVSDRDGAIGGHTFMMTDYYDVLIEGALGNYRALLGNVTLHPAMGKFLSMLGSRKADPTRNLRPDENFAREVLQLFSIGLVRLNLDGTPVDADAAAPGIQPVPTYSQTVVEEFARVFTGWNWADCDDPATTSPADQESEWSECLLHDFLDHEQPMEAFEAFHDAGEKQLLDYPGALPPGGVVEAGQTAAVDLDTALDNVFMHPNVAPFVARHLITRLVTSNPSTGYVARVAAVFDDDGTGMRGNLAAVVRALLLDSEARLGHVQSPDTFGKVREPLVALVHLWRAMDAHSPSGRYIMKYPEKPFLQAPLRAPSVFNFFQPDFTTSSLQTLGLGAPELQLLADSGITTLVNSFATQAFHTGLPFEPTLDTRRDQQLAEAPGAAGQIIDRLAILLMGGKMSPALRSALMGHLDLIPPGSADYREMRVREAVFMILMSPEFMVQQ